MSAAGLTIRTCAARETMALSQASDLTDCPACQADQRTSATFARYRVCENCGHHAPLGARERLAQLIDPGTFTEFAETLISADPLEFSDKLPYRERIAQAQERTGLLEAVLTGVGKINGDQAVLAIM